MPEAILLKDVENVGERGAVVDVSKGYLRNFLIPRKLAQPATKGAVDAAPAPQAAADARRPGPPAAPEGADLLNKTVLTIAQQAGDDGRLFGSVTTQDIADAIKEARGITSTAARSTSRSRSSTSAPTWSTVEVADGVTRQRQDHGGRAAVVPLRPAGAAHARASLARRPTGRGSSPMAGELSSLRARRR